MPPRTNPTKEGTMCTAFPNCRAGVQRLRDLGSYAPLSPGGFVAGPRTLRPERLQWLTTSAANRLASMRKILWSSGVGLIAQAAPNRSIHRVDTVRSGALEDLPFSRKDVASLARFWAYFLFFRILHRAQSWKGHSLLFFATWESGARLS